MNEIDLNYVLKSDFGAITGYCGHEITFADDLYLKLIFSLPIGYNPLDCYYVKITNNTIKQRLLLDNLSCKLLLSDLKTGTIKLTVEQVVNDKIIKTWKCENLILKNDSTDTTSIVEIVPELTDLKTRLSNCEKAISQINDYIKNTGSIL